MDLNEYVEHFRARVLQDAFNEATAAYWTRRAEKFLAVGTPTCDEIAQACQNAATLWSDQADHILCVTCGTPTSPWTCSCGETRVKGAE